MSLRWFFLESLVTLGVVAFIVNFALLVHWRRRRRARPLVIGLAISTALLTVSALVVTPLEHAGRVLGRIERDFLSGRADALAAALAPDFHADSMDAAAFTEMVAERLADTRVLDLRRTDLAVTGHASNTLTIEVSYLADVDVRGGVRGYFTSRWQLRLVPRAGTWRIVAVAPVQLQGQRLGRFVDLPR